MIKLVPPREQLPTHIVAKPKLPFTNAPKSQGATLNNEPPKSPMAVLTAPLISTELVMLVASQ